MSVRRGLAVLVFCLLGSSAVAQGFAGLGTSATGFAVPERGRVLSFPADHGAHPEFRIEWLYVTANLTDAAGQDYGIQWTLFRSALRPEDGPGWASPQLLMGHAGLTEAEGHYSAERRARGGIGQAGVRAAPFEAWIDDWTMLETGEGLQLRASGPQFSYDLRVQDMGPLVLQGEGGYSVKSREGQASHYYSRPFLEVSGVLTRSAGEVSVTGKAWLDREWSSQPLSEGQEGWDWVSLHFEDGSKLMGFRLREAAGQDFTSATYIAADGQATPLADGALEMTPLGTAEVAGRTVPVTWRIKLEQFGIDVEIDAVNDDAWMETSFPYWEGPVRIKGSHKGRGYLEMTGYE